MFRYRLLIVFTAVIALIFAGWACNFNMSMIASEVPTTVAAPTATENLSALETQLSSAIATGISGGKAIFELTEAQITTAANQALQMSGDNRIQNLTMRLSNGVITVTGNASQDGLTLPVVLAMKITVNEKGRPHTEIISGKLGPFPLPDSILEQMMSQFDQALEAELDSYAKNLFVEEITIANGRLTILARSR